MHIAIDHGRCWTVYRLDHNGGFITDEHLPTRRVAERIACWRDVQEAVVNLDRAIAKLDAAH